MRSERESLCHVPALDKSAPGAGLTASLLASSLWDWSSVIYEGSGRPEARESETTGRDPGARPCALHVYTSCEIERRFGRHLSEKRRRAGTRPLTRPER
jgi:hypothetical protein